MRTLFFGAMLLLCSAALPASASADGDRLAEFGLMGTWARDCSRPDSTRGTYELSVLGTPIHISDRGDERVRIKDIRNVKVISRERIALDWVFKNGSIHSFVIEKDGDRYRVLDLIHQATGVIYGKDGAVLENGRTATWWTKCAPR
jgi:hypothetical protein